MKNISKIVMVILGTIIGAGFASGREIYIFFGKYGEWGILGIIISGILTGSIIYNVLKITKERNVYTYQELIKNKNLKYPKANKIVNFIVNSFLLVSFFVMVAAFCAFMKQTFGIKQYISSTIFVLICYIVFEKSLKGMMKINEFLVPILLVFIFFLGVKNIPSLIETKPIIKHSLSLEFLISSILYTSYNSIILVPILISMKMYIKNEKEIKLISIISSIFIIILSLCIYFLLSTGGIIVKEIELPLIKITKKMGNNYMNIYSFVIIAAIFTSAISAGYSYLKNISKNKKMYDINLILICIIAIATSYIGFSNLVQYLYPIFGILGIIQIIFLKC